MSSMFYWVLFFFAVWSLYKDFKKTEGFIAQKMQHIFFIFFIFSSNAYAFIDFFAFIRKYQSFGEWSRLVEMDFIPVWLSFLLAMLLVILEVMFYVLAFPLLVRADFARKIIIGIIPLYIFTVLPYSFYAYLNRFSYEDGLKIFWVGPAFLTIYAIIFFVYKGEKMRQFFYAKKMLA